MSYAHLPDNYYDPPDPDPMSVQEEADQDLDSIVAEWADMGEYEVFGSVRMTQAHEPEFVISRVAHDGEPLWVADRYSVGMVFDTVEDLRDWLEELFPFPAE